MATANKIIEQVDKVKPNAYGEEEKFRWLCDLDGMVKRVVMQEAEGVDYSYPADMDTQLLIPHPWEGAYVQYLMAKIDFHNKDYNAYNNAALVFDATFSEYKKAFIRENMPKSSGGFRNVVG
jgi:hypothetical protein